jgi:hypothetical protein
MARDDESDSGKHEHEAMDEMTLDIVMDKAAAVEALAELYELLEEYGPTWYTEEMHHRAEAALRVLRDSHE